jgi:hypothetical protein
MKSVTLLLPVFALTALAPLTAYSWNLFLDGSLVPGPPDWQSFTDGQADTTTVVDFLDPVGGTNNQALRISTETGANEWYVGSTTDLENMGALRFRLVDFSPEGKENLFGITTRSTLLSPAPSLTLVDGRFKLWNYVIADTELLDLGPATSGEWHTVHLWARNDGKVKFWWDGTLVFDGNAPLVNPYDAYIEWGGGSWQYDASITADFDWVGWGTASELPIGVVTVPANGTSYHDPAAGFDFSLTSFNVVESQAVAIVVNGVDRTAELVLTGGGTSYQGHLGGLAANRTYQVIVTVTDNQSNTSTLVVDFDTFSHTSFQIEAEDWNYDGGQFIDDVVLSSLPGPANYLDRTDVWGVDELDLDPDPWIFPHDYRPGSPVGTQAAGDVLRQHYVDAQQLDPVVTDYNVSSVLTGEWLNYTRTFPDGRYHIYARLSSPNEGPFEAGLSKVTGATTANQTATPLGSFKSEVGHGPQFYKFIPLTDEQDFPVVVPLAGRETLRVTALQETYNANFFMLIPAPTAAPELEITMGNGNAVVSWPADAVGFTLQSAASLSPAHWVNSNQPVELVEGRYTVTSELTTTAQFFRLVQ